ISTASALVFKGTLPTLLFLSIIRADLSTTLNPALLAYFAVGTVATFLLGWLWSTWRVPRHDRGVYAQGAFRGNCCIIGQASAYNMYGDIGLSIGGLLLIMVTLTYTPLSVFVLACYQSSRTTDWRSIGIEIARNPLIIAALAAIVCAWSGISLPEWL